MNFDWNELAFGSKKPVNNLQAIFIAAPRELSAARFKQLVRTYLPQGNIVLGLAKEAYVLGLENQPQFRMLEAGVVQLIIDKITASPSENKIYTLSYFQRDAKYIFEKLDFKKVIFVNGSWQYSFHMQPTYYALANKYTPYELVSPFADEDEAIAYAKEIAKEMPNPNTTATYADQDMLRLTAQIAQQSFDHTYQTGVALAKKTGKGYRVLLSAFNKVIPYQTYAMHFGSVREKNFAPANDLNFYDTIHAEMALLVKAQKERLSLKNMTLFINLLPCPTCARTLAETDIAEVVYNLDHSDGYALQVLERAGKKVRRVV